MRKIILTVLLIGLVNCIYACDICGCSLNGNPFGILPLNQRNFASMRYQYHGFHTDHATILNESGRLKTDAYFSTFQVWTRFIPFDGLQLFASIPFNYYQKKDEISSSSLNGLGDISLIANVVVLNTAKNDEQNWKHVLQLGGGIKLPTGNSSISAADQASSPNFKSGTGSYDFPMNAIYTIRYKQTGLNTEINYQINTSNNENYRFGNIFKTSGTFFYLQKYNRISFLPNLGVSFENAEVDTKNNFIQSYTGGNSLFLNGGLDLYYRKFSFGINIQKPVYQNVGDHSFTTSLKLSSTIMYLF
ncbi:MAG TPA: hypothetical protein VK590_16260 [Saprospiraceae bacterium]|nr:hypothetical protein [Saprospiraceae bacterium]